MAPKILIVDDDPLMQQLYAGQLTAAGYRLIAADNARQAIELAALELPKVIIMDMLMPDLDGLTALRQLKKEKATQAIPVIIISGNTEYQVSQREAESAGAAFFLSKPFSPKQLLAHVHRLAPVGVAPASLNPQPLKGTKGPPSQANP